MSNIIFIIIIIIGLVGLILLTNYIFDRIDNFRIRKVIQKIVDSGQLTQEEMDIIIKSINKK
jgi:hypothetical protein